MQFPFTIELQGLGFTFERRSCRKDQYGRRSCPDFPAFIGASVHENRMSRRVGVCKHAMGFDLAEWKTSPNVQSHVTGILGEQRKVADRKALLEELALRTGDGVYEEYDGKYVVKMTGLTREQAVYIYKMAGKVL